VAIAVEAPNKPSNEDRCDKAAKDVPANKFQPEQIIDALGTVIVDRFKNPVKELGVIGCSDLQLTANAGKAQQ